VKERCLRLTFGKALKTNGSRLAQSARRAAAKISEHPPPTEQQENEQQAKTFYEREIEAHNNLQHRLEVMRNKKNADELKATKPKPKLNSKTRQIIREKLYDEKPLHKRTEEVLLKKTEKLDMLKQAYKEAEELEELERRNKYNAGGPYDKDRFDAFLYDQMVWHKNKEEKVHFIKGEINKIEKAADRTLYKPTINKTSKALAANKQKNLREKEAHVRLYDNHEDQIMKKQKMMIKNMPSFTPTINTKNPKYIQNKKEIFDAPSSKKNLFETKNKMIEKSPNKKFNNSMIELQSNFIKEEENEDEPGVYFNPYPYTKQLQEPAEDAIFSQYRLAVERSQTGAVKQEIKNRTKLMNNLLPPPKKKMSEKSPPQEIIPKETDWKDELDMLVRVVTDNDQEKALKSLYKLNVRSNSVWNTEKENQIFATPKFNGVLNNLNETPIKKQILKQNTISPSTSPKKDLIKDNSLNTLHRAPSKKPSSKDHSVQFADQSLSKKPSVTNTITSSQDATPVNKKFVKQNTVAAKSDKLEIIDESKKKIVKRNTVSLSSQSASLKNI